MSDQQSNEIGRNEPCPCGSGKKYKRCHGVGAAPKVTPPKAAATPFAGAEGATPGGMPGGFDPSKMDPQLMMQFAQMLQRLPKGQLQRLQGIMQKAMSGKDVTREAAEFERTLPVELQQLMTQMGPAMAAMGGGMPGMGMPGGAPSAAAPSTAEEPQMSADEAREIVAKAAAEGKISAEQAEQLLQGAGENASPEKKSGFSKFWKGITGKNP